jgi:hypothetical protein
MPGPANTGATPSGASAKELALGFTAPERGECSDELRVQEVIWSEPQPPLPQ